MDNKNEVIFKCRKCEHNLFVENIDLKLIDSISKMDCPNCGQGAYGNWILVGLGNSEEQKGDYNWQ
jgi:transcription elongation factor Elf1